MQRDLVNAIANAGMKPIAVLVVGQQCGEEHLNCCNATPESWPVQTNMFSDSSSLAFNPTQASLDSVLE